MNWIEEALAEQLHKEYRAAFKALHSGRGSFMGVGRVVSKGTGCHSQHDHGWEHCHRKDYFLRRARRWMESWPYKSPNQYYPGDLTSPFSLCLRHDHAHTVEAGCWVPAPREVRIKEAYPQVIMKDPAFESPEENT